MLMSHCVERTIRVGAILMHKPGITPPARPYFGAHLSLGPAGSLRPTPGIMAAGCWYCNLQRHVDVEAWPRLDPRTSWLWLMRVTIIWSHSLLRRFVTWSGTGSRWTGVWKTRSQRERSLTCVCTTQKPSASSVTSVACCTTSAVARRGRWMTSLLPTTAARSLR